MQYYDNTNLSNLTTWGRLLSFIKARGLCKQLNLFRKAQIKILLY